MPRQCSLLTTTQVAILPPSEADIRFTRDIVRAGKLLKIDVLDHIILGRRTTARGKDYVSLRELGYLYE